MVNLNVKQGAAQVQKQSQKQGLLVKIKTANILGLPEKDFSLLIRDIETDPLFKKLMYPETSGEKVLSFRRFPGTGIAPGLCEFKDELKADYGLPGGGSFDMGKVLEGKEKLIALIRKLGEAEFRKHFLLNDENLSIAEIAEACGLAVEETQDIIGLLNTIDIYNSFSSASEVVAGRQRHYAKIAVIRKTPKGRAGSGFEIEFTSVSFARGKYQVDYERLKELKRRKVFSKEESSQISQLLRSIELVNTKKSTIYKILEKVLEKQAGYFKSDDPLKLSVYSEKQLAREINADTSIVSRAISARSVEMPWGVEKSIKEFFPSRKDIAKEIIADMISREGTPCTDEQIRKNLSDDFGIVLSRRSVAACRLEMQLPANYGRKKKEAGI